MLAIRMNKSEDDSFEQCIRLLLERGDLAVNLQNNSKDTALHVATSYVTTCASALRLLLNDKRCDVNALNAKHDTAVRYSVRHVQTEDDKHALAMKLMLSHPKFDINQRNMNDNGILHLACSDVNLKSHVGAKLLLAHDKPHD